MFRRFKKIITLLLCAALFNACVIPSTALLAKNRPAIKKQQTKPVKPFIDQKAEKNEEEEETETKEPTIAEKWQKSWQKVINLEWKSLNRTDAWNIGGTLSVCILAYLLFRSAPAAGNNLNLGPAAPDMPGDQPENKNIIISPSATDVDKTKKTTVEPKKPVVLYPHAIQTHRQNVPVIRQAGASCGYHAILNSILSIQGIDENQANEIINARFAQRDGTWRAPMIQNRKKALVKNYIENTIHQCMRLNTEEEQAAWNTTEAEWNASGWLYRIFCSPPKKPMRRLDGAERRALNVIAHAYTHAFMLDENLILQEDQTDLTTQLQNLIRQYRPHIQLADEQDCLQCIQTINLTELQRIIVPANALVQTACTYAYGSNLETDLYGDNLNTTEIENLKALALREYGINDDVITVIDNTNLLNTEAYQVILLPAKEQMFENNCRHAFCMRTSRNDNYDAREVEQLIKTINDANATQEEKDKAEAKQSTMLSKLSADTRSTHWISVTLNRVNGQNTYLVKDSMGNDYTNHPNVLQLIEALEQPNVPQPIEIIKQPENRDVIDDLIIDL